LIGSDKYIYKIENSNIDFYKYLQKQFDFYNLNKFIIELCKENEVYIFSGIIRDYFLTNGKSIIRDIDIFVSNYSKAKTIIDRYNNKENQFGSSKVIFEKINIDVWSYEHVIAIKMGESKVGKDISSLLFSTFFNFSSILYSLSKKRFIYNSIFIEFLRDNVIDIVYEKNTNIPLCVLLIYHYSFTLNLKISEKTKKFYVDFYPESRSELDSVQVRHFGIVKYNQTILLDFYIELFNSNSNKEILHTYKIFKKQKEKA